MSGETGIFDALMNSPPCDDLDGPEAVRQRPRARKLMSESPAVFVPLTTVLELEWVLRGFYELPPTAICDALHWVCSRSCTHLATFDEKTFARRARKLGLEPEVLIPGA